MMMCSSLVSIVHSAAFKELEMTDVIRAAIFDITDPKFLKALCILLRAVFPAIRVLRYCDKGAPCMDKLYYLTYRATDALNRLKSLLNDPGLFSFEEDATLESSQMEVYGDTHASEIGDNDNDKEDDPVEDLQSQFDDVDDKALEGNGEDD
ncbi:hypothetical protein HJC23_003948, partial [Cyclotella cryptica]